MSSPYDLILPNDKKSVKILQATKQGYIICQIGGGGRFSIANIQDT